MTEAVKLSEDAKPVLVWFTRDLRISDNAALTAAVATGRPVIACYVLDDEQSALIPGAAAGWWLYESLAGLKASLESAGGELILRRGTLRRSLVTLVEQSGVDQVFASRSFTPALAAEQKSLQADLSEVGAELHLSPGPLLFDPETVRTSSNKPYRVFTPFYRACLALERRALPLAPPPLSSLVATKLPSDRLSEWGLLPRRPNWAAAFASQWTPGESGAHRRLATFIENGLRTYSQDRDYPSLDHTSRLSPHLAFGEISPAQLWHALETTANADSGLADGAKNFLRELLWREFSYHLLAHWPNLPEEAFREEFSRFPWRDDRAGIAAWRRGETGYPIVDAGMRQLWQTGWMHNRVRMIVASFLVKDLLVHWREGAAWFLDTLVDADIANNSASWQWVAGSGADAAPYFRIFNPELQGRKFDPRGDYVRRWVPELASVPTELIHSPGKAPEKLKAKAGIILGEHYPIPIVDHRDARTRALEAYATLKSS